MISEGIVLADRYEIISRIGTGGMSDVYKAQDMKLSRFVAIKVLKQEYAENQNFVTKFHAEAQAAAGLIHSNIVGVYDVGEDNGLQYIVMELVEGITLKHYIEKKLRLSVKESISIAIQMAQGLECAHKAGIIHRDVKPQNVIISKDGKVKVTDFGIAKAATSETITSNVMGSVHYTSPEQARGGYSDEKSDIYSLGIVLFEMLTGRVPFDGDTTVTIAIQHIQDAMPSPREFVNDVPVSIEQIIFKCTEKNSDRRYSSMGEVIADLKQSLLTPDENFIKRIPSGGAGGATRMVTEDDIKSIKTRTGTIDVDESLISAYNRNKDREEIKEIQEEEILERHRKKRPQDAGVVADPERQRRKAREIDEREEFEEEEIRRKRKEAAARKRREQERESRRIDSRTEKRRSSEKGSDRNDSRRRAGDERQRARTSGNRSGTRTSSARRGDRYRVDDDMDDKMTLIMRIIAVIVGIIILILIVFIARRVIEVRDGSVSENEAVSDNIVLQDVTGQSFDSAKSALESAGFVVQASYEASDDVESGFVVSQDPVAGSQIPEGYTVTLVVSSGTGNISVPSLMNSTAAEAKVALENMGLKMSLTEGNSDTVPSGSVMSQSPEAGAMVAPGSTVAVVISTGAGSETEEIPEGSVAVPNIIGMSETEAKTALTASGLSWSSITEQHSDSVVEGKVISQSVEPDTLISSGASVDFVLSLGPENVQPQTFSQNVQAPSGYAEGTAASITLTGNNSGKLYGQKDVTEFPVTIQIASTDVDSADTAGIFTISYTARVEGENEDGSTYTSDQQSTDSSQSIAFSN
ncbi:MAG: Stk1 family PASTA domain-containing Ser/Thr kinase [Lachnospiraceae bacterium]|nr:Stk1 family PASTA domain-containing Ser/Thr kinase [Lachnospiraceae bacterium]